MKNLSKPKVSIIIPTHNEELHISACLESLSQQSYSNLEIIVVDDGSTDGTLKLLKVRKSLKVLSQTHQGPGAARNLGAQKSRGEILVFVDADMVLDKNFVTKLVKPIIDGRCVGTFTKEEFVANMDNSWAKAWGVVRGFESGHMHPANYPDKQPVFRAIKRKVFLDAGGFDTQRGYDDDWSLSEKLGRLAQNAPGAIIYHKNPSSLQEIFTQSIWMSKRRYKFGFLGKLFELLRRNIILSLFKSTYIGIKHNSFTLFCTQLIHDLGITIGIIQLQFTNKTSR